MSMQETQNDKLASSLVSEDEAGIRVDRWFKRHFPSLTHGVLQKLLRKGQIRVQGKKVESSDRLEAGQEIRIPPSVLAGEAEAKEAAASGRKALRTVRDLTHLVLFEDDDVVVLNKPAGLAVQGGTGLKENLDDALLALSGDGKTKPKLVHRLDRDTSGVLLIARTTYAATQLAEAFRHRQTQKIYWAITLGVPKPQEGRVEAALIKVGEKMAVASEEEEEAKSACSLYRVLEHAQKKAAFVALWPWTGRTHQLRVHLAHLNTPILGDRLYGGDKSDVLPLGELGSGLHLHARRIILPHPRRGRIDVTAPLNPQMLKTFKWFGFDEKTDFAFSDKEI